MVQEPTHEDNPNHLDFMGLDRACKPMCRIHTEISFPSPGGFVPGSTQVFPRGQYMTHDVHQSDLESFWRPHPAYVNLRLHTFLPATSSFVFPKTAESTVALERSADPMSLCQGQPC